MWIWQNFWSITCFCPYSNDKTRQRQSWVRWSMFPDWPVAPSQCRETWSVDPVAPRWALLAGMATTAGIRRAELEGGLILACSIFPTPTHWNFCHYRHPDPHRDVDTHVFGQRTNSSPQRTSTQETSAWTSSETSPGHCRHSASRHNRHLNNSCITVAPPSIAHSELVWFVHTWADRTVVCCFLLSNSVRVWQSIMYADTNDS